MVCVRTFGGFLGTGFRSSTVSWGKPLRNGREAPPVDLKEIPGPKTKRTSEDYYACFPLFRGGSNKVTFQFFGGLLSLWSFVNTWIPWDI